MKKLLMVVLALTVATGAMATWDKAPATAKGVGITFTWSSVLTAASPVTILNDFGRPVKITYIDFGSNVSGTFTAIIEKVSGHEVVVINDADVVSWLDVFEEGIPLLVGETLKLTTDSTDAATKVQIWRKK